jgi:hypothetical protein
MGMYLESIPARRTWHNQSVQHGSDQTDNEPHEMGGVQISVDVRRRHGRLHASLEDLIFIKTHSSYIINRINLNLKN